MKRSHFLILCTILGLTAVLASLLAFSSATQAQRSARALEDCYTQRLLEAQEHLQSLAIHLDKTAAAQDVRMQVELLTGAARQADGVVSDLTALPLSHAAMSQTVRFCNQLSEYTLLQALLCASGQPLADATAQQLGRMGSACTLLAGQLTTAQDAMLAQNLRLSADGSVFYAAAQLADRPLEQVSDPDNGMEYPAMIYDGAFSDARHAGQPKALGEWMISMEEAVHLASTFVGESRVRSAQPGVETGGAIPCYGVTLTLTDGLVLNADVTRQGGRLLWIMPEHAAFQPALTLEECTQAAQQFLLSRGYGDMEANHYQVYDGLAVINFVAVQQGVLLYPDLVKVQIRMDTGELVGLESNNYLMNHTHRADLAPTIPQAQVLADASPRLSGKAARLCLIPYRDGEKLCWEIAGVFDDSEYRVYVDARTGAEVQVLKMIQEPSGEMAV